MAIPIANAPTLGRNRSSVRIATRKPSPGSPSTWSAGTNTSSNRSDADRVRGHQLLVLAAQALAVARDRERGQPAPALRGAREHRVDVGLGRVGDPQLLSVEAVAVVVRAWPAARSPTRRSRPRARSARTPPPRCRRPHAGSSARAAPPSRPGGSGRRRGPGARTRSRPRCTAVASASRIRHSSIADTVGEQPPQQPVLGQRPDQRPVDPARGAPRRRSAAAPRRPAGGSRRTARAARPAHAWMTAMPISSTCSPGSNSSVTPNKPIAG